MATYFFHKMDPLNRVQCVHKISQSPKQIFRKQNITPVLCRPRSIEKAFTGYMSCYQTR